MDPRSGDRARVVAICGFEPGTRGVNRPSPALQGDVSMIRESCRAK